MCGKEGRPKRPWTNLLEPSGGEAIDTKHERRCPDKRGGGEEGLIVKPGNRANGEPNRSESWGINVGTHIKFQIRSRANANLTKIGRREASEFDN